MAEPLGAKLQLVEIAAGDDGAPWEAHLTALGMFRAGSGSGVGGIIFQQGMARVLVAEARGGAGEAPAAAGPPAARRGGRVANVWLAVPDLVRTWTVAVKAGAVPLSAPRRCFEEDFASAGDGPFVEDIAMVGELAIVAGVGMEHGLVSWPAPIARPVPSGPDEVSIDYMVLAVRDVFSAARFYSRAFGMELLCGGTFPAGSGEIRTVVLGGAGWALAIVAQEPTGSPGLVSQFLATTGGPGIAHIAFRVPDILSAVGRAAGRGIEFLPIPAAHYDSARARLGYEPPNLAGLRRQRIAIGRDGEGRVTYQAITGPVTPASQVSLGLAQRPAGTLELSRDAALALAAARAAALAATGQRS